MTALALIAVDIGNSSTKLGWFADAAGQLKDRALPAPVATHSFATGRPPPDEIARVLPPGPCRWHIASVNRDGSRILNEWLAANRPTDEVHNLTFRDLPIAANVDAPERTGLDRLAAAVAANVLRDPGRPAIVIDAGSAITVDLVTAEGAFAGGVILPGFRLSAEALFGGTDQLPLTLLATSGQPPPVLGKNTEAAIRSGLFWGAVGAVREVVARMSQQLDPRPQVIVTGGDLRRLAEQLDDARFVPNLVLSGIAVAAQDNSQRAGA